MTTDLDDYFRRRGRKRMEELADEFDQVRPQIEYILKANRRRAEQEGKPFLQFHVSIHHDGAVHSGFNTPREYIENILKELRLSAEHVRLTAPPSSTHLQGQEFEVAGYYVQFNDISIYQRTYVRYVNDDVLILVASYATDEHVRVLQELVGERIDRLSQ